MAIGEETLREICDRNNISDYAEQCGINVKRSGLSAVCCCPFHNEKTPSCHLYEDDNHFHCYGCGAHGSVIKFAQQVENLDFFDAAEMLARRAGVKLPEDAKNFHRRPERRQSAAKNAAIPEKNASAAAGDVSDEDNSQNEVISGALDADVSGNGSSYIRKDRLVEINTAAARYFRDRLISPDGRRGMEYLSARGLSADTIRRFGLGFADDDYERLFGYMKRQGYSETELKTAALITTRDGKKYFDKFRNRIMFPVFDLRGRVIAFGGRTLSSDKKVPKYLNSDETPLFRKRETVFAMNYAKNSSAEYFILCEGYMDVISMHQAGFDSAVASLGTAITEQQARLLARRGKKEIILSYDSDEAGKKAASRAVGIFMNTDIERVKVLKISGAKDPDEYIKNFGAEAFGGLLKKASGAVDFEIERLCEGLEINKPDGKNAFIRRAVPYISAFQNAMFRELCAERAAEISGIPAASVRAQIDAAAAKRAPYYKRNAYAENHENPEEYRGNYAEYPNYPDDAENNYYEEGFRRNKPVSKNSGAENAERAVMSFLFHNPEKLEKVEKRLPKGLFTEEGRNIYDFLREKISSEKGECRTEWFAEKFPEQMSRITDFARDEFFAYDERMFIDAAERINEYHRRSKTADSFGALREYIKEIEEEKED